MPFLDVILPLPFEKPFTYEVPSEVPPLTRVLVPLGRKKYVGLSLKFHSSSPPYATKLVLKILDTKPLLDYNYFEWLQWGSQYYLSPIGEVVGSALPSRLLEPRSVDELQLTKIRSRPLGWEGTKWVSLNQDQQTALEGIPLNEFSTTLLHGITGSGKTEVYLHLIRKLVDQGKQALMLVPEIGLTPQMLSRFQDHFGESLGVYHSGLTPNQKLKEWFMAQKAEARVTIGTRSALFLPYANLGAIILDEEHDGSYKQEEGFRYHARDLAIVRGQMAQIPVVLGSATPSLESFHNARKGKYRYACLSTRPIGDLPAIQVLDMAAYLRQSHSPRALSEPLHQAIETTLAKKEQVLIYLNRRGFARTGFCLACEKNILCPNCSVNLVYHRTADLRCHYCDFSQPLPKKCPQCGTTQLTLLGTGTQTLEEELKTFFPEARIARLDRDSTTKKGSLSKILEGMRSQKIDILVGTQMIAKGHDLPLVTLVGVLGVDTSLGIPDFRASERAFQQIVQVSGRAGRRERAGHVILQCFAPKHYSIELACKTDFDGFYEKEIAFRQELGYPPIGRLIHFIFSSPSNSRLTESLKKLEDALKTGTLPSGIQVLGPSPAPLEKIRGRYRWQLLLKGRSARSLKEAVQEIQRMAALPSSIKCVIDVDPINML